MDSVNLPSYIPESQTELDAQLLRIDTRSSFKNKQLGRVLSDDMVRSYLDDYQIKALYHLAAAYEGLVDASTGRYVGVFDNAAEMVLTDMQFLINIARSKQGINVRVVKGRSPLEELKKKEFIDRFKPPVPEKPKQYEVPEQYYPQYDYQRR